MLAKSKPLSRAARTVVSTGFQDVPDLYDVGTAVSSASIRPSDSCQKRACEVRLPVSSLTRCAFGSFSPLGSFSRLGISRFPPTGGAAGFSPSSENQPAIASKTPVSSPAGGEGGAA